MRAQESTTTVAIVGAAGRGADAQRLTAAHFSAMVTVARCIIRQVWGLSPPQVHLVSGGSSWTDHVAVALYVQSILQHALDESEGGDASSRVEDYAGLTLHLPTPFHSDPINDASQQPISHLPSGSHSSRARVQRLAPHACGCAASVSYAHPHFHDNGARSWKTNPGRVLNTYHSHFSAAINQAAATAGRASTRFSSFDDLCTALALGADMRAVQDCSGNATSQRGEADGDAFHKRNSLVARSSHLLAFTFGGALSACSACDASVGSLSNLLSSPSNQPCAGGTADTWRKCRGKRIHVPLLHLFSPRLSRCLLAADTGLIASATKQPHDLPARSIMVDEEQRPRRGAKRRHQYTEHECTTPSPQQTLSSLWLRRA